MSMTLATVADALIEFILSLLRDPELRAEFEEDPDAVLAQRGLHNASPADVHSVAPVIIERTQVVQVPVAQPPVIVKQVVPAPEHHHANPVVREIQQVTNHFAWVDDRDTIVDQSVNQNIWAEGDVTQTFDNEAIVASGDEAIAAGDDVDVDETLDQSSTIDAGGDVNVGNETDVTMIDDAFNEGTDVSNTTDDSTDVQIDDSANDDSTDVQIDDSFNDESSDVQIEDVTTVVDAVFEAPIEMESPAEGGAPIEAEIETAPYTDSAAEYTETSSDLSDEEMYSEPEAALTEAPADDNF